jgi:hypothetical protein
VFDGLKGGAVYALAFMLPLLALPSAGAVDVPILAGSLVAVTPTEDTNAVLYNLGMD